MRLICPNCDAQYEVPDEGMPAAGRDVQCSNCGQTWFQHHPDNEPLDDEEDWPEEHEADPAPEPELPKTEPKPQKAEPRSGEPDFPHLRADARGQPQTAPDPAPAASAPPPRGPAPPEPSVVPPRPAHRRSAPRSAFLPAAVPAGRVLALTAHGLTGSKRLSRPSGPPTWALKSTGPHIWNATSARRSKT